ncbi:MAG: ornithine carbamoyltransferase [Candidatus Margulisiibacteriota bacterium]|jgi:ornithine carbamoyltransferase
MQKKNFISILDFSKKEIIDLLDKAKELKILQKKGNLIDPLKGKTLAMIFQKPSNRTRVSFEVGMYQLGGLAVNILPQEIELGVRESIPAVAKTLSRFVDGIMLRVFKHTELMEFTANAEVPIINGLSDLEHPCQALADLLTIQEKKENLENLKICYIGDGNNVCNSLIQITNLFEIETVVSCPKGYEPTNYENFNNVTIVNNPEAAIKNADIIYTDVWISMGQEKEEKQKAKDFQGYTITKDLLKGANPDFLFMHCLPAHPGQEVTEEVLDLPNSIIFDQAENRLHAQKAILYYLLR